MAPGSEPVQQQIGIPLFTCLASQTSGFGCVGELIQYFTKLPSSCGHGIKHKLGVSLTWGLQSYDYICYNFLSRNKTSKFFPGKCEVEDFVVFIKSQIYTCVCMEN